MTKSELTSSAFFAISTTVTKSLAVEGSEVAEVTGEVIAAAAAVAAADGEVPVLKGPASETGPAVAGGGG